MPKYVIERSLPGAGNLTQDDLIALSQKSCSILQQLGPNIRWIESFVTRDKIYCIFSAPSERLIWEHAQLSGFPADRISQIYSTIDPSTAEDRRREEVHDQAREAGVY
jgi:hypothetical protein